MNNSLIRDMYLSLLSDSLMFLRYRLKDIDPESYRILDAIHNVPMLLKYNKELYHHIIYDQLIDCEKKFAIPNHRYSKSMNNYEELIRVSKEIITSGNNKACAYVVAPNGEYLLQRRSADMYDGSNGKLSLFGGGLDSGETIIQGLIRELYEEIELDINLCTVSYVGKHISFTDIAFEIFEVRMNQPQHLVLQEGDEIVKVTKEQLYDGEITSWFDSINRIYGNYLNS